MLNAGERRGALRAQRRQDIGTASANIRHHQVGSCKGGWTANDTTMEIFFLAEPAGHLPQALSIQSCIGPHPVERRRITKAILINRLMDNRHAFCLRQQHRKWLLPISHETRVYVSLDSNRARRAIAAKEAN